MKKIALVAAISATLLLSGCARQMDDNPAYYQGVETLNISADSLAYGEMFYIGSVEDKTVPMNLHVIATEEGENRIKIAVKMSRQDTDLIVSSSSYIYDTTGDGLSLVEHIPEQTGLVGSWWIPRLNNAALNTLQVSKPNLSIWKKIADSNSYMHEGENFTAGLYTAAPQIPGGAPKANTPLFFIFPDGTCQQLGLTTKAKDVDVKLDTAMMRSAALGSCSYPEKLPVYSLKTYALDAIKVASVQGLKDITIKVGPHIVELPLDGFNYAYSQAQLGE
ncbi:hypothetical protein [Grimontia hollisae]|uniref:Lipoprotein n=1 Tax=Grimontia hollisae TaxID=673 RepID=A0A377HPT0_GRIHO|nr:hypothetical protein [Grimontia hollisae]STO58094.1 Uncharacterised protein [Grimontia hollisae]